MPKVIAGASTLNDVCGQGGVDYAAWLILGGLLLDQILTDLATRFPSASASTLTEVYGLAEQSIQAGAEINTMGPAVVNPPSGIPGVPGVPTVTYVADVQIGIDIEGDPVTITRKLPSKVPLTKEEIIDKIIQDIIETGITDYETIKMRVDEWLKMLEPTVTYAYQPGGPV